MAGPVTRKSHLISAFFLAAFSTDGERETQLQVLDQPRRKVYAGRPEELAIETDAYLINADGLAPGAFEDALEGLETRVAPILRTIREKLTLPTGDDFQAVIEFVATLAVRDRRTRANFDGFFDGIGRRIMRMILATPERYADMLERADAAGLKGGKKIPYDDMKRWIERGEFDIKATSTTHAGLISLSATAIIPYLAGRKWSLLVANDGEGDFVCSDHPVSLSYSDGGRSFYGPGFGLEGTDVTVPIGRRVALVARFEGEVHAGPLYRRGIAGINSKTAMSGGCIYSATGEFLWLRADGRLCRPAELMAELDREAAAERRRSDL